MSNIKNEVIQKLRSDIRTKLDQIGAFVDNELADYIMVLVANQKTKYQMKDDLSLFLGAETDEFVNWLHSTLKLIQLNATEGEDKKVVTTDAKESKELSKHSTKPKTKSKRVDKHLVKSDKTVKQKESLNTCDVKEDKSETIADNESNDNKSKDSAKANLKAVNAVRPQIIANNSVETEEQNEKQDNNQSDGEVILHLNPDGGDVDELLQESDVNEVKKTEVKEESKEVKVKATKSAKEVSLKRQPLVKTTTTVGSAIGAVVRNKPKQLEEEDEEEEYNQKRPVLSSVASVVRVTERKFSVPNELQANKNLLLRAMKAAHESTVPNRKRVNDRDNEIEYTPTPIKKRLGERPEAVLPVPVPQVEPQDLRNVLNVTKKDPEKSEESNELINNNRIVKQKAIKEMNPQFVVTLDGVDHNKYSQNTDLEDQILLDEEMDEEFLLETVDNDTNDQLVEDDDEFDAEGLNERCRYWPSCTNKYCEYQHPTITCTAFPNCRFGDKCLYVHPNCKYDTKCTRRDCPFTHLSKRKIPTSSAIISTLLPPSSVKQCKYVPNCKNPACPYWHPKVCHFGVKCRSHNCPFIHPNSGYSSVPSVVPHPHQLKWKARNHISERAFAVTTANSAKTTTTLTSS